MNVKAAWKVFTFCLGSALLGCVCCQCWVNILSTNTWNMFAIKFDSWSSDYQLKLFFPRVKQWLSVAWLARMVYWDCGVLVQLDHPCSVLTSGVRTPTDSTKSERALTEEEDDHWEVSFTSLAKGPSSIWPQVRYWPSPWLCITQHLIQ